ncbi:hypothetical protein BDP27DRAFT_172072 [Rhodocollybia butyracea]|uniref:Uncharacterized protein n=1 Tax=Rhodocollybia butyracea TaxID=206335 RepID=A0A9P5PI09_9AGAR|nr:hypothetical protein BDP27DRAFT_172072 [Rhodocollybia butyracea]
MWFVRSHQSSDAGVVTNWQSTFQGCLSDLPAEMVNALEVEPNLLEVLKVFHDRDNCDQLSRYEFWLFVDEAQMLYDRAHFWTTIRSFISLNSIKFYVVAAGTYGSHTSSASSSPPSDLIPRNLRMNIFPSEDNCNSGIAFTKEEFNEFVDLLLRGSHHSMDDDTRDQIVAYASPCPPNPDWERFIHPGVATELTRFVIQIRSRVCCLFVYKSPGSKPRSTGIALTHLAKDP